MCGLVQLASDSGWGAGGSGHPWQQPSREGTHGLASCSWGVPLTQRDVGWRAQGSGLGPDAGRRGGGSVGSRPLQGGVQLEVVVLGAAQGQANHLPGVRGCGVTDGDPEWEEGAGLTSREAQGWPGGQMAAEWPGVGAGPTRPGHRDWAPPAPAPGTHQFTLFSTKISFIFPPKKSTPGRGRGWGTGHRT